jgi:hypothetical protein
MLHTPLFAFMWSRRWPSYMYIDTRESGIYFGFLCRWPMEESDTLYRWSWERKGDRRTLFQEVTDQPQGEIR